MKVKILKICLFSKWTSTWPSIEQKSPPSLLLRLHLAEASPPLTASPQTVLEKSSSPPRT